MYILFLFLVSLLPFVHPTEGLKSISTKPSKGDTPSSKRSRREYPRHLLLSLSVVVFYSRIIALLLTLSIYVSY